MKVLYLGYLLEQSEWGNLSRNFVRALSESGIDLAIRPIALKDGGNIPDDIVKYSVKDIENTDVIIHHLFPDHLVRWGSGKNIGLVTADFFKLKHSSWVEKFKLMDELWVVSDEQRKNLEAVGLDNVRVVKLPVQDSIYKQQFSMPNNVRQQFGTLDSKFKVHLPVMEMDSLEKSASIFFSEFDTTDNAGLLISCPPQMQQKVQETINQVKESLKLKSDASLYPQEVILPLQTEADLYTIHSYADAAITNNLTSGFTLKEVDAFSFGCPVLSPSNSVLNEFFTEAETSVNFSYKICKNRTSPWPDMYNGKDYQPVMCELDAKEKLRGLYNLWKDNPVTYKTGWKKIGMAFTNNHSLQSTGNQIKEFLNV